MSRKPKPCWRLTKTLSRRPNFRPIKDSDISYAWAAYRAGDTFRDVFPAELTAPEFKQAFGELVNGRYDAAWVLFAETSKGFLPVGLALGFWPHRVARPFMVLDAMVWFPWASPRNRIEATTKFVNEVRHEVPLLAFARERDKRYLEMLARHGVARRIGTSMNVFAGETASVWETTRDQKDG